jgi:hypothetical protein
VAHVLFQRSTSSGPIIVSGVMLDSFMLRNASQLGMFGLRMKARQETDGVMSDSTPYAEGEISATVREVE